MSDLTTRLRAVYNNMAQEAAERIEDQYQTIGDLRKHSIKQDKSIAELEARVIELEARLVIDKLNPNRREHIVQLTSRIDAVMKHIEERYDPQEPWTTPEEVKAILRGGLWS
jgi:vacuolar-type H+-ATPase subunit I/STV1